MGDFEVTTAGQSLVVSRSDRVTVVLTENATAGYEWAVSRLDEPLVLESSTLVPPTTAVPGAAAQRRFAFRARHTGEAAVELALRRPWEDEPKRRFGFSVTVT